VDREFIKSKCPEIDLDCGHNLPILGALYHPPGAIARHDAVAWGYGRGASQRGVEIHQQTEVTAIETSGDRVTGVMTNRGHIATNTVVSCVAGYTPRVTSLLGIDTPLVIHPLQACVTEPMKPWLHTIIVSGTLHIYVSQSSRGELVMGASLDPYEVHNTRSTLDFTEGMASHLLELFPFLGDVRIMRQWAGLADMTPDFSPIMGLTPVAGFYLDAGWGTWGFKATPVCGMTMAHTVATGAPHPLIEPFRLSRYSEFDLVGEKGAASVGH
jgi:sarcosine oxidase subunit beta